MKKIFFLLGIITTICNGLYAQTLVSSNTSISSGGIVTVNGSGETYSSTSGIYWSAEQSQSITVVSTGHLTDATLTFTSVTYYNKSTGTPTTLSFKLVNNTSAAINVTFEVVIEGYNVGTQKPTAPSTFTFTVAVQPAGPTVFNSTYPIFGTFIKNTCGTGSMGSTVTYTSPQYSSTISLDDANQKALTDVNNNGQTYANNNGTCTVAFARLETIYSSSDDDTNLQIRFYTDAACTIPLAIPSQVVVPIQYNKYQLDGTPYSVTSVYTVSSGLTLLNFGHRNFYPPNPTTFYSDWVSSVSIPSGTYSFTVEPTYSH